ncbi:MAG TPA: NAD(P)/FAD-dependent oxidoreductase [Chthoniobacterales bacterium]|nr:NAD(P)/FAD-dependent oxidoreductase [Chthoniobacterales bacterium]
MSQLFHLQKMHQPMKVLIIGAGTGGLSLAQGLKSDGISVQVFERDQAAFDRQAGYRLSINPTGSRALKECLPESLFETLVQNSVKPSRGVSFLDERLKPLLTIDIPETNPYSLDSERPITRIALRRVLLEGLDGIVQFGKKFVGLDDAPSAKVTVRFEDGSSATGDVLVGADGANSRVRSQLLPHAERIETGLLAVSGKLSLNDSVRAITPPAVFRGPTLVMGPKGCFLFANAVEYADMETKDANSQDNVNSAGWDSSFANREEYVMWGFSARREKFALALGHETLRPEDLKTAALALMKDWDPALRQIVRQTSDLGMFPVKTSVPVPPWETRNVTLLGDALHNMTPFRGMGANMALRDAAALRRALVKVAQGEALLLKALAGYEQEMIEHGFRAVRLSLENMERLHSEGLRKVLAKFALRLMNALPPLKERFHSDR